MTAVLQNEGEVSAPVEVKDIRILIVDDSRLQRKILSGSLTRLGYIVREADSGDAALGICESWAPDLVLSDWMMPGMDGLEFCKAFKSMPSDGYGYFILLTSKSAKDEVAQGLESGADDFLTKPVNSHELRARLAAGERIVEMHRELHSKNRMISDTLHELQAVHDSLNSDLIEAKKLQQSLVREKYREYEAASVSFLLRSSGHVGGDLVGYFPISETEVGLFSIDVSGHGISSALMTARLAGFLTSPSPDQNIALTTDDAGQVRALSPSDVVTMLNQIVLNEMETDHYFTMILAIVDLSGGHVRMCQAGHPHPLVQRRSGEIEQSGTGGLPIGLFPEADYEEFSVFLSAGDRLILSSDGITECPSADDELLGEEGFEEVVRGLHGSHGPQMLESMLWILSEYAGDRGFPDDVSAVLLEMNDSIEGEG